ncbi:MAG: hypothetical protein WDM86_19540 [Rhizomicrobium sp.]
MAYIMFVNPQILARAGMDPGAVFVATCVASAATTLLMGLYANLPVALAPGDGAERLFRLHRRAGDGRRLAPGAGLRVPVGHHCS